MSGIHKGHPGSYNTCKHPTCSAHRLRYLKRWRYERSHGHLRLIDAHAARQHILTLLGADWSYRAIAAAAGVSPTTTNRVGRGEQAMIQRRVEAKILGVSGLPSDPVPGSDEPFISRVGTNRRIQALLFMGWTHEAMLAHSGVRTAVTLNQAGRWVVRSKHDAVAAMYDTLWMKPGPSQRTRDRARKLGYVGPLDWDDIDHDAQPVTTILDRSRDLDYIVIERILSGEKVQSTVAEKREVVRRWDGSLGELERLTGWNVNRYRTREEGAA